MDRETWNLSNGRLQKVIHKKKFHRRCTEEELGDVKLEMWIEAHPMIKSLIDEVDRLNNLLANVEPENLPTYEIDVPFTYRGKRWRIQIKGGYPVIIKEYKHKQHSRRVYEPFDKENIQTICDDIYNNILKEKHTSVPMITEEEFWNFPDCTNCQDKESIISDLQSQIDKLESSVSTKDDKIESLMSEIESLKFRMSTIETKVENVVESKELTVRNTIRDIKDVFTTEMSNFNRNFMNGFTQNINILNNINTSSNSENTITISQNEYHELTANYMMYKKMYEDHSTNNIYIKKKKKK